MRIGLTAPTRQGTRALPYKVLRCRARADRVLRPLQATPQGGLPPARRRELHRAPCKTACHCETNDRCHWLWQSVPLWICARVLRIPTTSVRTGLGMTGCKECGDSGRCGERTERCQWQRKRSERVAAVKILSVRRKAAQKFWAPQQGHRPLRKCYILRRTRATARVAPTQIYPLPLSFPFHLISEVFLWFSN